MSLLEHFQMLGRYNTIANRRLYEVCAQLSDAEYRRERAGSFRSIHRTLNHILLGDRIWMIRFTATGGAITLPLDNVLYNDFASLRAARESEDARIEAFLAGLTEEFLTRDLSYVSTEGNRHVDPGALVVAHFFNHQTHHRAQVHTMLSDAGVQPPLLDMHRAIRPDPVG